MINDTLEDISCPYCHSKNSILWTKESDWIVNRCIECSLLYLNPRPNTNIRDSSTILGIHQSSDTDILEKRQNKKVLLFRRIINDIFKDVWQKYEPISWIDIGAGYGELIEAVKLIAHPDSRVIGLEPMLPKVVKARALGHDIIAGYIDKNTPQCNYASAINIFSHIYNFDEFLSDIRGILKGNGELFIETGDMTNVSIRKQFPGDLGLPDHVAFASEKHLVGYLERNGFEIVSINKVRVDNFRFTVKNSIKKIIGRNTYLSFPYSSPYRSIRIRSRKIN